MDEFEPKEAQMSLHLFKWAQMISNEAKSAQVLAQRSHITILVISKYV